VMAIFGLGRKQALTLISLTEEGGARLAVAMPRLASSTCCAQLQALCKGCVSVALGRGLYQAPEFCEGGEMEVRGGNRNATERVQCERMCSNCQQQDAAAPSGFSRHATSSSAMPGVEEPAVWRMIL